MLSEFLFAATVIAFIAFPVAYAIYYKLENKILFLAACYGIEQIVTVLLFGLVSPLILLSIFTFPQLEANGSLEGINLLLIPMELSQDYWFLLMPVILFIAPFIIQKRYENIFIVHRNT